MFQYILNLCIRNIIPYTGALLLDGPQRIKQQGQADKLPHNTTI